MDILISTLFMVKSLHNNKKMSLHKEKSYKLAAFLLGIALTIIPFAFSIFSNNGLFMYMGDFDAQQLAFYQHAHDMILSGNTMWDPVTDLGVNFIGSYSFYLLGSPFFWITLLFPSSCIPYLVGPILMIKFGLASLTSYLFLSRYVQDKKYALIGSLLYAFSSYAIINVFYNHFHDVMVLFPLLLYALDEYMYNEKKGIFGFMVFASALINYYFFAGQVVFVIIYWSIKVFSKQYKITLKKFFWLAFEAICGLLMSSVLLFPAILSILQNSRVSNTFAGYGWNTYFYEDVEKYPAIIASFFFPADLQYYSNMFGNAKTDFASLGAWLPLFGVTGTLVFINSNRKNWLTRLLKTLIVFAFVPILNSAFQLFNPYVYFRWFYMLTLVLSLATVLSLERYNKKEWKRSLIINTIFTLVFGGLCLFTSTDKTNDDGKTNTQIGICDLPSLFIFLLFIAILSLILLYLLYYYINKAGKKKALNTIICSVCIIAVFYNFFSISISQMSSKLYFTYFKESVIDRNDNLNLDMSNGARIDLYQACDNVGLFYNLPNISTFHSILPGSVDEFYDSMGTPRNVCSTWGVKKYGIQGFLSTKYLLTNVNKNKNLKDDEDFIKTFSTDNQKTPFYNNGKTLVEGWTYLKTVNGFDIYENSNYIPMGFYYDGYITQAEYNKIPKENRHLVYNKAIILSDKQVETYSNTLKHLDIKNFSYTYKEYVKDCSVLNKNACNSFEYGQNSFNASITTSEEKLIVFSVPYESGWTATVNGSPATIEKVSNGFMAIKVPSGKNEICFSYKTPGLSTGLIISIVSFSAFLCYILFVRIFSKNKILNKKTYKIKRQINPLR